MRNFFKKKPREKREKSEELKKLEEEFCFDMDVIYNYSLEEVEWISLAELAENISILKGHLNENVENIFPCEFACFKMTLTGTNYFKTIKIMINDVEIFSQDDYIPNSIYPKSFSEYKPYVIFLHNFVKNKIKEYEEENSQRKKKLLNEYIEERKCKK